MLQFSITSLYATAISVSAWLRLLHRQPASPWEGPLPGCGLPAYAEPCIPVFDRLLGV